MVYGVGGLAGDERNIVSLSKRELDELPDEEYSFQLGYAEFSDSLPLSEDDLRAWAEQDGEEYGAS